jgi:hypothetical protein
MAYLEAGEFSNTAVLQEFTDGGAGVTKGDVVTITGAAASTVATCDASGNAPYAVATETVAAGKKVMCVVRGEVSVTADGNCYTGVIVGGKSGKVKLVAKPFETLAPAAGICPAGKVTEGGATGAIVTIFLGQVI